MMREPMSGASRGRHRLGAGHPKCLDASDDNEHKWVLLTTCAFGHALRGVLVNPVSDARNPAILRRVARYRYRCAVDGVFDVPRPIGTAGSHAPSPVCNSEAVRVFSAPMLSLAPRAIVTAIDKAEKTRDDPEVVSALPPHRVRTRRPAAALDPALQRLPRP